MVYIVSQATIEALQEFDAESAAIVRATAGMKEAEYRHLMTRENLDVSTKRKAYMKYAVRRILVQDVYWQCQAFAQVGLPCCTVTRLNRQPACSILKLS